MEEEAQVRDKGALCRPGPEFCGFHTQAQGLPGIRVRSEYLKVVRQFTVCSWKLWSRKGGWGRDRVTVGRAGRAVKRGNKERKQTGEGEQR